MTNPFLRLLRLRRASAWIALLAVALAPLAQAMRAPARAIDVPYCAAGAGTTVHGHGAPAPLHGHIVLTFTGAAGSAGAQPHPFLPSSTAGLGVAATAATTSLAQAPRPRVTQRAWSRPLGRAPPTTAADLA